MSLSVWLFMLVLSTGLILIGNKLTSIYKILLQKYGEKILFFDIFGWVFRWIGWVCLVMSVFAYFMNDSS